MNIAQAKNDVQALEMYLPYYESEESRRLKDFINEVEELLKHNSIKQTPALLRK